MNGINPDQFEKEGKVKDIPDNLKLQCGTYEVKQRLEDLGIDHDPQSIVLEDSFNCIFEGNNGDNYEIWVCHKSVPYLQARAYKVDLDKVNQEMIP